MIAAYLVFPDEQTAAPLVEMLEELNATIVDVVRSLPLCESRAQLSFRYVERGSEVCHVCPNSIYVTSNDDLVGPDANWLVMPYGVEELQNAIRAWMSR